MRRSTLKWFLLLPLAFTGVFESRAAIHNFSFQGEVTEVNDPDFQFNGTILEGGAVQGFYVYDDSVDDENNDTTVGDYRYTSSRFGITVKIGTYVFRTDPEHTDFLLEVVNRDTDNYVLRSYHNICSAPLIVSHISWQLNDPTGMALSSDLIPTEPPTLSAYESTFGLTIEGGGSFLIRAKINSITPTAPVIPDPPAVAIQEAVELRFPTALGYFYQIQVSTDLSAWNNIGQAVLGDGTEISKFVPKLIGQTAYYRATISTTP